MFVSLSIVHNPHFSSPQLPSVKGAPPAELLLPSGDLSSAAQVASSWLKFLGPFFWAFFYGSVFGLQKSPCFCWKVFQELKHQRFDGFFVFRKKNESCWKWMLITNVGCQFQMFGVRDCEFQETSLDLRESHQDMSYNFFLFIERKIPIFVAKISLGLLSSCLFVGNPQHRIWRMENFRSIEKVREIVRWAPTTLSKFDDNFTNQQI